MPKKIRISCADAQYERLIDAAKSYFENDVCFLGRRYETCPAIKDPLLTCEKSLRQNIVRVDQQAITDARPGGYEGGKAFMKKWLKAAWVHVGSWLVSIGVIGALILIGCYGFCEEPIALHELLASVDAFFCALLGFLLIPIGLLLLMATLHEIDHPLSIDFFVPLILTNLYSAGLLMLSRFSPALMEASALAVLFFCG